MEEQIQYPKQALDKFRQWHFWWLIVFSFFLIITFVYYLPTRFLHQSGTEAGHAHDVEEEHGMMGDEMHEHMDGHMSDMDMDEMMEHMMEGHDMAEHDAQDMMDEMMGHNHDEATEHEHESTTDDHSGHSTVSYHEESSITEGLAINLNINPVPYRVGVPLAMSFFVNNKPGNVPIPASSLELEHEKLMHVVGVRSDMNEFFHIHPEPGSDGIFKINYTFAKPGLYKIWSDVKKDGGIHLYGHPEVNVIGSGPKEEKKVVFDRNVITGNYQVSLVTNDIVVKGRDVSMTFDIHSLSGQEINVENYLGAKMHLVLIKDDWKKFIHTHPSGGGDSHDHSYNLINSAYAQGDGHMDHDHGSGDETISFNAVFPEAGLYKAFAQFRPEGTDLPADEALTAEFWIQVEEKSSLPISQWWLLLLISAVLMAGLSLWVNSYLKVKPESVTVKK